MSNGPRTENETENFEPRVGFEIFNEIGMSISFSELDYEGKACLEEDFYIEKGIKKKDKNEEIEVISDEEDRDDVLNNAFIMDSGESINDREVKELFKFCVENKENCREEVASKGFVKRNLDVGEAKDNTVVGFEVEEKNKVKVGDGDNKIERAFCCRCRKCFIF